MPSIDLAAIQSAIAGINLATPSWDLFILLFFVVGSLIYGFTLGRERIVVLIVAIYMSLAVISHAPYLDQIQAQISYGNLFAYQITTFVGLFLVLFFLLSRSALLHSLTGNDAGKWWHVILFSFLHVGLLISMTLSYLPHEAQMQLLEPTRQIFTSEQGKFAWIVLPIIAMMLVRGEKKKE